MAASTVTITLASGESYEVLGRSLQETRQAVASAMGAGSVLELDLDGGTLYLNFALVGTVSVQGVEDSESKGDRKHVGI